MSKPIVDLSVLSRSSGASAPAKTPAMPMPGSKWRTRVLLPGVVLALFGALLTYAARDALLPATEVHVTPVISKAVSGDSGSIAFQAAGWIEADPFGSYVSSLTDGVIKELLVLEGQRVEANQVVARMVDDDAKLALASAEAHIRKHQAELAEAEAALTAAQRQWDNPVERVRAVSVAEGALEEYRAEYAKNEAEIAMQQARADELKDELKRADELSTFKAIAEGQHIQSGLRLKTQLALIEESVRSTAVLSAKIKQQEAELLAAKDNLRLRIAEAKELDSAKAAVQAIQGDLAMAEASRDEAKLRLHRMEIRANAAGVVLERFAEPGSKMMMNNEMHGNHVLRIYNPEKLQVRVDVPLADAAHVSVGQDAQIVVEVLRDTTFKGKITRILHQADIQKNTLQVKVAIEKPAPELKPEMLARVQFVATEQKGAETNKRERLFAPENALQRDGAKAQAWIVDKGHQTATHRNVTLGSAHSEGWIEVTDGVQPGDVLIIGDTSGLREGQRVRIAGESNSQDTQNTQNTKNGGDHAAH